MPASDVDKVLMLMRGVASRDAELAAKYVDPDNYKEHNPRAADGIAGLREYVGGLSGEGHQLEVVRAFQDGAFVFTQAQGRILGQNVFFDVFRFEADRIVEHWVFSAEAGPPNKSGHTQADGPTEVNPGENMEKNKALLREYYETVHIAGRRGQIPHYFRDDHCIRHEPGVADGVAAFMQDLEVITRNRSIDEIVFLLGQGDFVFIAARGSVEGRPCLYIDLYRVEAEKIVEHWGFPQEVPPQGEWKNGNGML